MCKPQHTGSITHPSPPLFGSKPLSPSMATLTICLPSLEKTSSPRFQWLRAKIVQTSQTCLIDRKGSPKLCLYPVSQNLEFLVPKFRSLISQTNMDLILRQMQWWHQSPQAAVVPDCHIITAGLLVRGSSVGN